MDWNSLELLVIGSCAFVFLAFVGALVWFVLTHLKELFFLASLGALFFLIVLRLA